MTQGFVLHPDVTEVTALNARTLIARFGEGEPALVVATRNAAITTATAWYFPSFGRPVETVKLVIEHQASKGDSDQVVLLRVVAPGGDPTTTFDDFAREDQLLRFEWTTTSGRRTAELRSPD